MTKPSKGFILKKEWAEKILSGEKTLEIRNRNTKIRGTVGVIISGTSKVWGTIDIVDSIKIPDDEFESYNTLHRINCSRNDLSYKQIYGWKLENPVRYSEPIPYEHKLGCVIWVNLD